MIKEPVRVIIGREVELTAPGMLGRRFNFKPGYSFLTQEWFYPGEPYEREAFAGQLHDQWSFGTNTGTDLPLTFEVEDIREVIITHNTETARVFAGTPFKVTIIDRHS